MVQIILSMQNVHSTCTLYVQWFFIICKVKLKHFIHCYYSASLSSQYICAVLSRCNHIKFHMLMHRSVSFGLHGMDSVESKSFTSFLRPCVVEGLQGGL